MSGCLCLCDSGIPMCLTLSACLSCRDCGMHDVLAVCSGNFSKYEVTFLSAENQGEGSITSDDQDGNLG